MAQNFSLSVLGPTTLFADGAPVSLRPKEREVLAAIALRHPRPTTTNQVVDLIWGDDPPATARKAVQNHVLRIRRAAGDGLLDTVNGAYAFGPRVTLDTEALTDTMSEATSAQRRHDHGTRRAVLESALAGLDGEPFADLVEGPQVAAARRHIREVHAGAEEGLAEALLAQGAIREAIELLARLTAQNPYRERRWWLLMLAQYRAGRRRDALATYNEAREQLVNGAGIEPGDELSRLERLIGADDPMLMTPAVLATPVQTGSADARRSERFVGREIELERLGAVFDHVLSGQPSFVVIEGEAGIGKTTLARQFGVSVADRARLVWGPCDAAPTTPLQPFGRALDELLDADSDEFPSWLSHDPASLAAVVPRLADRIDARADALGGTVGDAGHYRLFDAVADALISAAREHPLIVILDDFQLAPPTTRRLVSRCLGSDAPLLMLATWRTGPGSPPWTESDAADDAVERVTLDGLSEASIARWLASLLGGDVDVGEDIGEAAQWLHKQTGGNPLFVRELTTTLLDREAFASGPGPGGFTPPLGVPEALREVLLDRVRGLAADTVAFLRAASVLGTRFRPSDLQALVDTSPARQIAEATSAGILRSGPATDEVEFTHDLVRRALYDTLAPGTRVELHDLAAQAAAGEGEDGRLAEIAWHRLAATPIDAEAAVDTACRAGDASMKLFAFDEAARLYEGAQTAAGTLPGSEGERRACAMAVRRGDALRRAGDPANVDVLVEAGRCAESLDDPDLLARAALALCQLGLTTEAGGSDVTATDLADRALTRATDPRLRAEVAATASLLHSLADQPARCRELFENAEREARATEDPEVHAVVLPFAYLALARPSDLDRRSAIADELLDLGRRLEHLPTEWEGHQLRMSVRLVRGDPTFFESFDQLASLTETLREPTRMWTTRYLAAVVAHVRGDLPAAEREMTASLDFAGVVATSRVMAIHGAELLAVRAQQGRLGELADTVAELTAEQPGIPAWHAATARIASEAGDISAVCRAFDRLAHDDFAELPDDFTQTAALHALGRAAAAIGDARRSRLVYDRLASCSGLMSWFGTGTFGPVDQSLGECARAFGDRDSARRHLALAQDISTKLGAPLFAREAEEALGTVDA